MPFGPYGSFEDCVSKNGDKSSPEGFCAWLEHKITGKWPGQMSADKYPEVFMTAYDAALVGGKTEPEAYKLAEEAAKKAGYSLTRFGWVKAFQAPTMKKVSGVRIFAAGTWTDSSGTERTWTEDDLNKMSAAFQAGVPDIVPLKCGHTSDEFNQKIAEALKVPVDVVTGDKGQGQISIGKMTSLERKGDLLVATFDNIPEPIANLIEGGQYSTVSVEIEDQVGDFGPVITGVALLGAEEPAVDKATLERALVFGGARKGARVMSFAVGEDIPIASFRAEIEKIRKQVGEAMKGKNASDQGLFGKVAELFDRMVGGRHTADAGTGNDDPEKRNAENKNDKKGGNYQMDMLKKMAEMLGLKPEATEEEVLAAMKAMMDKAAAGNVPPEMAKELKKATDEIADLKKRLDGSASLSAWKEKTAKFTAIPGTALEHATALADIESKAGKPAADAQFKALEEANRLAEAALKVVGTSRTGEPTDFDKEVEKYQKANPTVARGTAIKTVAKERPDLWVSRNG
jgi:hypothetical protein